MRLTEKDIQLLSFLGRYRIMIAVEAKKIYGRKNYYLKRLKALETARYIQRMNYYYIKLDTNGTKLIKKLGYNYNGLCRKKKYQDRIKDISKIAALTLDSSIELLTSSEVKDSQIYTEVSRKFIGELFYQNKRFISYYISKEKDNSYIKQVINDMRKTINYKYALIFLENFRLLNKSNQYFILGRENTLIIKPNKVNLDRMKIFQELDFYEVLLQIYKGKEVLLSNWEKADYMTEDTYIILTPFIDVEKLHRLNIFYNSKENQKKKIDIITLKENITKIKEILTNSTNIIELDGWLGGISEDFKEV
ncbi:MAG: hypothetical protein HFJ30_06040 [Clostridia bacterium]|nr:hypothetical protein [Clostridia bacterium]